MLDLLDRNESPAIGSNARLGALDRRPETSPGISEQDRSRVTENPASAAVATDIFLVDAGGDPLSKSELAIANDALFSRSLSAMQHGAEIVVWGEVSTIVEKSEEETFLARGQALSREHGADLVLAYAVPVVSQVDLTSSRQESPKATGRCLCSLFAACFRGGATLSHPYFG